MTSGYDEKLAPAPPFSRQIRAELSAFLFVFFPFALANALVIADAHSLPLFCAKIVVLVLPLSYLSFQLWKQFSSLRLLTFALALLAGVEIYLLQQLGTTINSGVFSILFSSDSGEALAYLYERKWLIAGWIAFCMLCHVAASYLSRHSQIRPSGFLLLCLACSAGYAFYLGALSAESYLREQNSNRYPVAPRQADEKLFGVGYLSPVLSTLKDSFPYGLPVRLGVYLQEERMMRRMAAQLQDFRFHARHNNTSTQNLTLVLVLGETARFDRFSVNGYERDTSPNLSRLERQAELISMRDMITPRSFTMGSIPIYLSGRDIMAEGLRQRSLIAAFKEAGFKTYFLSTQVKKGFLNNVTSVFADEAEQQLYYEADETRGRLYDEVLLEPLQRITSESAQKKLIVMHTMGSHAIYTARYPKAFEKYPVGLDSIESVANAFDNTIYYTDHLLAAITDRLRTIPGHALMVYGSDHGESLPTPACKFIGHGALNEENLRVPYFVWANLSYRQQHEKKWQNLRQNQAKASLTSSNFFTLLDLAEISYPGYQADESLAGNYTGKLQRWVRDMQNQSVDFNQAQKQAGSCGQLQVVSQPPVTQPKLAQP